ncbi:MAG: gliding motility-associated C-terminal domain-containing protein [Bacteroidota bacterium]
MKIFLPFLLAFILLTVRSGFSQGNDCSNALVLSNVNNFCSAGSIYTNVGSTASGFAVASCWAAGATEDVWFSFTATGTDVLISVSGNGFGGTMGRPRIALYAGSCATTINQLGCNNGAVGSGISQLYVGGLSLAQTYYIRVSSTAAQEGTFELCVNNYVPPASASADCGGAGKLCNKNGLSVGTLSGGGTNANEPESSSCMVGDFFTDAESNSVWYTWTCATSGTLVFDITPLNSSNDIDYVLWQLNTTNPCGARTVIRCNTSSCLNATGSTGLNTTDTDVSEDPGCEVGENSYCQQLNMVAGTSYALLINNADGNSGFGLSWGGTGTFLGPDANIVASDTTICAGESVVFNGSTSTDYTSLNWTFNSTGSPVSVAGPGPHTINFPTAGNYVAILQANAAGCSASTEFKNIIVGTGTPITATSATICPGTSTVLTASGGTTYTWSPSSSLNSPNGTTVTATPSVNTTYTIVSFNGSCTSSTTVGVDLSTVPGITVSSTASNICVGGSSTLTATGAGNYTWSPSSSLDASNGTSVIATPSVSTEYTVIGISSSCTTSATFSLTVSNSPTTTASASSDLTCLTTTVNLNSTLAGMNYTWTSPAGGAISSGSNSQNATTSLPGTYTLEVLNPAGNCTYSTTATVVQNTMAPIGVDAGTDQTLTCGTSVSVTLSGSVTSPTNAVAAWSGPSVCGSASSYTTFACGAGTYTLQATDPINGCVAASTVQVFPSAGAPTVTVTASSNTINCTNTLVTVSLSTTDTPVSYNWSGTGIASDDGLGTITVTQGGTFNYTVTNTNSNCNSSSNYVVFENTSVPTSTAVSTGTLTCMTTTVTLNTLPAGMSYTWTAPAGGIVSSANTQSTTVSGVGGTYSLTVKDPSNNCVYNTTTTVIQNTFSPVAVSAGSDKTLTCIAPTQTLTGSVFSPTTSTVIWTGPNVCSTATDYTVSACSAGIYTMTAKDPNNSCVATSTVEVFPNPGPPTVTISSTALLIDCNNATQSATVTSNQNANVNYSWSIPPASTSANNSQATFNASGTYSCIVSNTLTGCTATVDVVVTTNQTIPTINNATVTCYYASGIGGSALTTATNVSFSWSTSGSGTIIGGSTSTPTVNSSGIYVVLVTDYNNGCTNTGTITVIGNPVNAMFSANPTSGTAPLDVTFTDQSSGVNTYSWNFGDLSNNLSSSMNPGHTYNSVGMYTVELIGTNGICNDTAYAYIEVLENSSIIVPNVFTPNGDGANDVFKIVSVGMKDLSCDIFNRWGTKVHSLSSINDSWNGGDNSAGTYFFILKCTGVNGKEYSQEGHISLLK